MIEFDDILIIFLKILLIFYHLQNHFNKQNIYQKYNVVSGVWESPTHWYLSVDASDKWNLFLHDFLLRASALKDRYKTKVISRRKWIVKFSYFEWNADPPLSLSKWVFLVGGNWWTSLKRFPLSSCSSLSYQLDPILFVKSLRLLLIVQLTFNK